MSCSSTKICSSVTLEPRYGNLISSHSTFYLRSLAKRKISSSAVRFGGWTTCTKPQNGPSQIKVTLTWTTRELRGIIQWRHPTFLFFFTHTTHTLATFTHTHTPAAQVSAEKNKSQLVNGERLARHDAFCFVTISQREVKRQPTNTNLFVSSDFFCCRRHTVEATQQQTKHDTQFSYKSKNAATHTHTYTHHHWAQVSTLNWWCLLCVCGGERRKKVFSNFSTLQLQV